jgi:hypothetical protein
VLFSADRIDLGHPDAAQLSAYTGTYHSSELDTDYTLSVEQGKLIVRRRWTTPLSLDPLAKDEFLADDSFTVVFRRDAMGRFTGFQLFTPRARNITFERTE